MAEQTFDQTNISSAQLTCTKMERKQLVSLMGAAIAVAILTFGLIGENTAAQWWAHRSIASSELPSCYNGRTTDCIPKSSDFANANNVITLALNMEKPSSIEQPKYIRTTQSRTLEADTYSPGHVESSPSDPSSQPSILLNESINTDYISMLTIDEMLQEERRHEAKLQRQEEEIEERRKIKSNLRSKMYESEMRMMEMKLEKLRG